MDLRMFPRDGMEFFNDWQIGRQYVHKYLRQWLKSGVVYELNAPNGKIWWDAVVKKDMILYTLYPA